MTCEHDWMGIQANDETKIKYGPYAMGCAKCDAQGRYDWKSKTVIVTPPPRCHRGI